MKVCNLIKSNITRENLKIIMLMRFTLLLQLILLLFNNAISQCTYTFPVSATLVCSDNGSGFPDYGSPSSVMNNRVFVSSSSSFLCEAASMGISAEMEPTCCIK